MQRGVTRSLLLGLVLAALGACETAPEEEKSEAAGQAVTNGCVSLSVTDASTSNFTFTVTQTCPDAQYRVTPGSPPLAAPLSFKVEVSMSAASVNRAAFPGGASEARVGDITYSATRPRFYCTNTGTGPTPFSVPSRTKTCVADLAQRYSFERGAGISEFRVCLFAQWDEDCRMKSSFRGTLLEEKTRCRIEQASCAKYPSLVGSWNDAYDGADSNQDRCLARATDYAFWCANPPSVVTTASFLRGDTVLATRRFAPLTKCRVEQSSCALYPGTTGVIIDTYDGANSNQDRCLARATDYAYWCGNPPSVVTTASFLRGETVLATRTFAPLTMCRIEQSSCANSPSTVGVFVDDYDGSPFDQDRCLARASEWALFCANPSNITTTATFLSGGVVVATRTAAGSR